MARPVPMYLISAWLAIWLIGVPLRHRVSLEALIGAHPTLLVLLVAVVAAFILGIKFLQCERAYVDFALGIISMQLGYLLTRFFWLLLHDYPIDYPVQYLLILGMNLFYVIYLMQPMTQHKIARLRAALLAKRQGKNQTP